MKPFMPYINKGEVFKETPPFQRTMNFNVPKHCSSFTNLFMLFSNFATEPV